MRSIAVLTIACERVAGEPLPSEVESDVPSTGDLSLDRSDRPVGESSEKSQNEPLSVVRESGTGEGGGGRVYGVSLGLREPVDEGSEPVRFGPRLDGPASWAAIWALRPGGTYMPGLFNLGRQRVDA